MVAQLIVTGAKKALKQIKDDEKQSRFAASKALNAIARPAIDDQKKLMKRVFDRPTRFVLNSMRVNKFAKRNDLELKIGTKDVFTRGGFDPLGDTLRPHIDGGRRVPKTSERRLRRQGILANNEFLVPSRTAPLNKFGNITKGVMNKILADLNAFGERGFSANRTSNRKRQYIIQTVGGTRGIFKIKGGVEKLGAARIDLVFLIVRKTPIYRKVYDFRGQAEKSLVKRFESQFDIELARAFATRR